MKHFLENRTDIDYTGYDIVPANIEMHKRRFSGKNWKFEVRCILYHINQSTIESFQVHDIVTDQLSASYDLILSRHTMQHLKNKDVRDILKNFVSSGSIYMLATNYPYLDVSLSIHYKIIDSFYFRRTRSLMKEPRQECEVSISS